jgi:hypothetical protein
MQNTMKLSDEFSTGIHILQTVNEELKSTRYFGEYSPKRSE